MASYTKLMNGLTEIGMRRMQLNLDFYADSVNKGEKTFIEALEEMVENEIVGHQERAINACVKTANFPFIKTLDDYDFSFQPSVNKQEIMDLKSLRFVENKENLLFVGSSGVGKTHLATAVGIECATNRCSTYFICFESLMRQLKQALNENRLEDRLKFFAKYKVLIIDEIGYLPIDSDSANLFFQLIARRYERKSTVITTNANFSSWGDIFGSAPLANAILDRLLHHSIIFSIRGPSYRLKDKASIFEGISTE